MTLLSQSEILVALNLIPGLGSKRIQSLLEHFGSAELVLEAPANLLARIPGIGPKLAAAIADWRNCTNISTELERTAALGARIITLLDDEYPTVLRRMSDPPIVLYVLGAWHQSDAQHSVAIVGTRQASTYGTTQARRFARELSEQAGSCIISGLARGIDTAGHLGALDAAGRTIAVLGSGLGSIFPPENRLLAERILSGRHGAIVSEFPINHRPSRITFPQRNRIVAAWSRATLVIEAPLRSGALHTARLAAEQYGNSVFALPGPVNTPSFQGCHALIRDGATLCSSPKDLISDMGWEDEYQEEYQPDLFAEEEDNEKTIQTTYRPNSAAGSCTRHHTAELLPSQRPLIDAIRRGYDTIDQLCTTLGCHAGELAPALMQLVIAHHLVTLPGGRYKALP